MPCLGSHRLFAVPSNDIVSALTLSKHQDLLASKSSIAGRNGCKRNARLLMSTRVDRRTISRMKLPRDCRKDYWYVGLLRDLRCLQRES